MSGPQNQIPEELHVLAGEYVLGALDAAEMRAVRRQAMVDPSLAAAITGWEQRLAPMAQALQAVSPPEALWARIEQTIAPLPEDAPEPVARPRLASSTPAATPPGAPPRLDAIRPAPPAARSGRVWPWQIATAASLALAAGVAGVVLMPSLAQRLNIPLPATQYAPEVAVLMPAINRENRQDGPAAQMAADTNTPRTLSDGRPDNGGVPPAENRAPAFLAEARQDGTVVLTALAPVDVPTGKSLELWILPPGAKAPRSLGVLPAAGRRVAQPAMPPTGSALLVSLEPSGGSPTGSPTGPVMYAGKLGRVPL